MSMGASAEPLGSVAIVRDSEDEGEDDELERDRKQIFCLRRHVHCI